MSEEIWRPVSIPDFSHYKVSNIGRVMGVRGNKDKNKYQTYKS